MKYYLAIDIGASSGRHILGSIENGGLVTEEVYRFENGVKNVGGRLEWDITALFESVLKGIKAAFERQPKIESLAIDTWGVDYVLMNGEREITPCYSYRDRRTDSVIKKVHEIIPFDGLYARTGIQFQPFNTVYQLYCDKERGRLDGATDFLMIPEYLNYKLTGVKAHEYTNATTTGLVNGVSQEYDKFIINELGLPEKLFCKLHKPATVIGELKPEIAAYIGGNCKVTLCASHDTASAVEGIPMQGNSPYISSGTWSLLGLKVPKAITDENSRKANYSNEGGAGYIRYQKNVMGMWVVNRLREELCPARPWEEITAEAAKSGFSEWTDVNADAFLSPESMKAAFDGAFKSKPESAADYFNCAYISLAHCYKSALDELGRNTGEKFSQLYIVGGGAKNKYLNKLTEEICKIKVNALPIEATTIGNLKIQIKGC